MPHRIELARNPYFHVWSAAAQPRLPRSDPPGDPEAREQAVQDVIDGRADLIWAGHPQQT